MSASKTKETPKKGFKALTPSGEKILTDLINCDREVASCSTKATKLRAKADQAEAVTGVAIRDRIILGSDLAHVRAIVPKRGKVLRHLDPTIFTEEFWGRWFESSDYVGQAFAKSQKILPPTGKSNKKNRERYRKAHNKGIRFMLDYRTVAHQAITIVLATPDLKSGLAFVKKHLEVSNADWGKGKKAISDKYWTELEARSDKLRKARATVDGFVSKADQARKKVDHEQSLLIHKRDGSLKTEVPRKPRKVTLPYLKSK